MGVQKVRQRALFVGGVVGGEAPLSTSETDTGLRWIDGKPIYQKVIGPITGLNNNSVQTPHDIGSLTRVVGFHGFGSAGQLNHVPLPSASPTPGNVIEAYADGTNVVLTSEGNWQDHEFFVVLRYVR
jgi:hypothetical protein